MDGPQCPGCIERDRVIDALLRRVADLEKRLGELERTSKRQAAPFSKGRRQARPKNPGRKAGPENGDVGSELFVNVAIPTTPARRTFRIHKGSREGCGRRIRGHHPLQTSDATEAA
jgi:hypothetical protein